ncbi:hypothetical protein [Paenibacillus sp. L3-i20]|uniref:hypothetical protein n=1 Tax=Paenibacillus sp. L3-i20 TaxID=2905833 RepID=UPI001EDFCF3A|nr:hypothetical protein [Paenibacillus sp. L3-i20]GKU76888.1 hypothetical protein L3i20_v212850 [Paenibacillus sp. L3-i20]
MISSKKLLDYICSQSKDTSSEKDLFIRELCTKIEFGHFDPDEEDTSNYEYENFR